MTLVVAGVASTEVVAQAPLTPKAELELLYKYAPLFDVSVRSQLRFRDSAGADQTRAAIRQFVWPTGEPRNLRPTTIESASIPGIHNARLVQKWTSVMHLGVSSQVFFLESPLRSGCLAIYQDGHNTEDATQAALPLAIMARMLARGCDVLLVSMPLYGVNTGLTVDVGGRMVELRRNALHGDFFQLETEKFSPFSYFFEPLIAALNEATGRHSYQKIGMIGFSGGGWAATFFAAIEPRLTHVYPVAGTAPHAIDVATSTLHLQVTSLRGDYEQSHPVLYAKVASMFDLYVLGAIFPGRRATHIYNKFDTCCFPGIVVVGFRRQMEEVVREMSGNAIAFAIDEDGATHTVSEAAIRLIEEDFLGPAAR